MGSCSPSNGNAQLASPRLELYALRALVLCSCLGLAGVAAGTDTQVAHTPLFSSCMRLLVLLTLSLAPLSFSPQDEPRSWRSGAEVPDVRCYAAPPCFASVV